MHVAEFMLPPTAEETQNQSYYDIGNICGHLVITATTELKMCTNMLCNGVLNGG